MFGLAHQDAILHLVLIDWTSPAGQVMAVENRAVSIGAMVGQYRIGRFSGDLPDLDVPPADLAAVGLKLDRALGRNGNGAVPEVFQDGMVHNELAIEVDRGPRPCLNNPEGVPLANGVVRQGQGVFAGVPGAVVPEPAGALGGAVLGIAGFSEIPDLNLRRTAEINPAVALGADLEIDEELDVAVILVGGQVDALTVVDDFAMIDTPMRFQVLRIPGELLGLFVCAKGMELPRIGRLLAVPAGQVLAVEKGDETVLLPVGLRWRANAGIAAG